MPKPVHTPRLNNNDDTVRVSHIFSPIGSAVRAGDPLVDLETDKATFTVESEFDGYLLEVTAQSGDMVPVGSVLAWIGSAPDEKLEEERAAPSDGQTQEGQPTLKALFLLKQYSIDASEIPSSGGQLTAEDVLRYARSRDASRQETPRAGSHRNQLWAEPPTPGHIVPFTPEERGMLHSVSWQRENAVPAYLEIGYDPSPWEAYARAFREARGLWYDPLLALLSWRLVRTAVEIPQINSTASPSGKVLFDEINLGFTVQAGSTLYLVVVRNAQNMEELDFVRALGELQLSAMRHSLTPDQTSGATVAFSSMARWNVSRHVPVLPPQTAFVVSHTAAENGIAHIGATYDHRLLTGSDAVRALQKLIAPPADQKV